MELTTYNVLIVWAAVVNGLIHSCDATALHFQDSHRSPSSDFSTFDLTLITVYTSDGRKLDTTLIESGHCTSIGVKLTAFNTQFDISLHLNRQMFAANYIEKSMSRHGELYHSSVNQTRQNCYYTGSVNGQVWSTAAVSTCHGIQGYFMADGETYHIEPAQSADIADYHYVYRDSDSTLPVTKCGTESSEAIHHNKALLSEVSREIRSLKWPQDKDGTTRVVELFVVNDKSQYLFQGADISKVTARTKEIVNVISSLFQLVDIYIVLIGVEVWTDYDRITIQSNDVKATLNSFLSYRESYINPKHSNDNAHLITNIGFADNTVGLASVGTMCTYKQSGGINSDLSTAAARVGTTMAHEMGHNFGLVHDDQVPSCRCSDPTSHCIMYPTAGGGQQSTKWSECSLAKFQNSLSHGLDICLHNSQQDAYQSSKCGNGIVDSGEECDCGSASTSECNPNCCDSLTCKLKAPATCAAGRCCDISKCELLKQATACRSAASDCDLPEYCDGKAAWCPVDAYKWDGTDCTVSQVSGYCNQGECHSLRSQCQLLWGPNSDVSDKRCFEHFNVGGTNAGNCGMDWQTNKFIACPPSDVMCGQLHCSPAATLSSFSSQVYLTMTSRVSFGANTYHCNSTIIDVGMQVPDPGMVPDGVKCADGKMCLSHQCVDVPKCPLDCSGHGVCNNVNECHCDKDYGPPDCSKSGCGGSYSSGSPKPGCENTKSSDNKSLTIGLCILFLVILPLLVVGGILGYRYRDRLRSVWDSVLPRIPFRRKSRRSRNNVESAEGAQTTVYNNNDEDKVYNPQQARPARPQRPNNSPPFMISPQNLDASTASVPTRSAPPPPKPAKPTAALRTVERLNPKKLENRDSIYPTPAPAGARPPVPRRPDV